MQADYHSPEEAERLSELHDHMLSVTTIQSIIFLLFCNGLAFYFPTQTWFWHLAATWIIIESLITLKIKISEIKVTSH